MESQFVDHSVFDYDKPLDPYQFRHLLDLNANKPLSLRDSSLVHEGKIILAGTTDLNDVEQCDTLVSTTWLSTGRIRRIISFPPSSTPGGPVCKRKRKRVTQNLVYPTFIPKTDGSRRRVNQGKGGDLNFLPSPNPVICKQSCGYHGTQAGNSCGLGGMLLAVVH